MKADFLVKLFDRAVLALLAARRRRRRGAEMAQIAAALEDLELGPSGVAAPAWQTPASSCRLVPEGRELTRGSVRWRTVGVTALVAVLLALFGMVILANHL